MAGAPLLEVETADAEARLTAASGYLKPTPPQLVAIGGPSGSSKTAVATRLAPSFGPLTPETQRLLAELEQREWFSGEPGPRSFLPCVLDTRQSSGGDHIGHRDEVGGGKLR